MSCWTTTVCGAAAGTVTIVTGRRRCGRSGLVGVRAASGFATLLEAVNGCVAATNGRVPGITLVVDDGFEDRSPAHAGPASSRAASVASRPVPSVMALCHARILLRILSHINSAHRA